MVDFLTRVLHGSAWLRGLFLLIAWLAVWQVGRLVEYTDHASVWFPVAGLTFAALLVLGKRAVLPIMTGAVLITIWSVRHYQFPLNTWEATWAGLLFGVAHILPYWLGALLVGRLARKAGHGAPQLIVTFLVVLMSDLDRHGACRVAERARAAINRIRAGQHGMSCSFGIAQLLPGEDFKAVFGRADMALYDAKRQGGNRVMAAAA